MFLNIYYIPLANIYCSIVVLLLKSAVQRYIQTQKRGPDPLIEADELTTDDWHVLDHIKRILKPITKASLKLESRGVNGNTGSLFGWMEQMDTVMTALEEEKEAIRKDTLASTHLKVFVDLIWVKVDYYY